MVQTGGLRWVQRFDGAAKGKRIEIWFQDEARIGQKNKITRRYSQAWNSTLSTADQRTRSADIFGAICPKLGKAAARVMPWCDTYTTSRDTIENWLSNRIFKSYEDIVAHCCDAWRKLESQPWRIMSIGRREVLIKERPYQSPA